MSTVPLQHPLDPSLISLSPRDVLRHLHRWHAQHGVRRVPAHPGEYSCERRSVLRCANALFRLPPIGQACIGVNGATWGYAYNVAVYRILQFQVVREGIPACVRS